MKMQTVWCTVSLDCDESQVDALKSLFPKAENVKFFRYHGEGRLRFDIPAAKAMALDALFPGYVHLPQAAEMRKTVRLRTAS
jgi:hypothetical protein